MDSGTALRYHEKTVILLKNNSNSYIISLNCIIKESRKHSFLLSIKITQRNFKPLIIKKIPSLLFNELIIYHTNFLFHYYKILLINFNSSITNAFLKIS